MLMFAFALCAATLAGSAAMPAPQCPVGWTLYTRGHSGGVRGADVGASSGEVAPSKSRCIAIQSASVAWDEAVCPVIDGRASRLLTIHSTDIDSTRTGSEGASEGSLLAVVAGLVNGAYQRSLGVLLPTTATP